MLKTLALFTLSLVCLVSAAAASDVSVTHKGPDHHEEHYAGVLVSFDGDRLVFNVVNQELATMAQWAKTPEDIREVRKAVANKPAWKTLEWRANEWTISLEINDHGTQNPLEPVITNSAPDRGGSRDLLLVVPKASRGQRPSACNGRGLDEIRLESGATRPVRSGHILSIEENGRVTFQETRQTDSKIYLSEQLTGITIGACAR